MVWGVVGWLMVLLSTCFWYIFVNICTSKVNFWWQILAPYVSIDHKFKSNADRPTFVSCAVELFYSRRVSNSLTSTIWGCHGENTKNYNWSMADWMKECSNAEMIVLSISLCSLKIKSYWIYKMIAPRLGIWFFALVFAFQRHFGTIFQKTVINCFGTVWINEMCSTRWILFDSHDCRIC